MRTEWRRASSLFCRQEKQVADRAGSSRPLHVCVVGSGPGGFYTVEALQRLIEERKMVMDVDLFERQAVPYGLVRFGVAPDHPEVKAVQHRYDSFMNHPRIRFVGNVSIGSPSQGLSVEELLEAYDGVVLAAGAQLDRPLGVPGESLAGVHSAREFVAWYNGDPLARECQFELSSSKEAMVIGQGNVALDVARVLLRDPSQLATTDMPVYALSALRQSTISTVHIVGRRGPAQASFTNKELREILNLPEVECHLLPSDVLSLNEASKVEISKERGKKRMIDLFTKISEKREASKKLFFHFLRSPTRFLANEAGRVCGIELVYNELRGPPDNQKAVFTGKTETIGCDIVFKSIGYKSEPLAGVPFDQERGIVPNERGRVLRPDGSAVPGLYVSGWMKRGPSGVIGTNRTDAEETVDALWADLIPSPTSWKNGWGSISSKLQERNVPFVDWKKWKAIECEENRRGQELGKEREKITSTPEMLDIAFKQ